MLNSFNRIRGFYQCMDSIEKWTSMQRQWFLFDHIPTGNGRNQPIHEHHVTKSGRNRVKGLVINSGPNYRKAYRYWVYSACCSAQTTQKQFKSVEQSRQLALRAYCPNVLCSKVRPPRSKCSKNPQGTLVSHCGCFCQNTDQKYY